MQSIPIQRLQGFRPTICFLACKSKISLWGQFKTQRDGNLVKVEWELTVRGRVIPSKVNEESAVLGHVEELLQGLVGGENEFEPP